MNVSKKYEKMVRKSIDVFSPKILHKKGIQKRTKKRRKKSPSKVKLPEPPEPEKSSTSEEEE